MSFFGMESIDYGFKSINTYTHVQGTKMDKLVIRVAVDKDI